MKLFKGLFGNKEVEEIKVAPKAATKIKVSKMDENYVNPKEAYRLEKEERKKQNEILRLEEEKRLKAEAIILAEAEKEETKKAEAIRQEKLEQLRAEAEEKKAQAKTSRVQKELEEITFAGISVDTFSKGDNIKVEVIDESRDAFLVRCVTNFQDAKLLKSELDGEKLNIGDVIDVIVWKHYIDEDYVSLRRYKNKVVAQTMLETFDTNQVVSATVKRFKAPMFDVIMDNNVKAKVFIKNMDTKFITEDNANEYVGNTYEFLVAKKFNDAMPNEALFELNRRALLTKLMAEKADEFAIGQVLEVSEFTPNKGGLGFEYDSISGFVPMSEISHNFYSDSQVALENTILPAKITIIEIKRQRGQIQLVGSIKKNLISKFDEFVNTYHAGDIITAEVTRKENYGLIMKANNGFTALLHSSEFSTQIATDIKTIKAGDQIDVLVKYIDFDNKKVQLSANLNEVLEETHE